MLSKRIVFFLSALTASLLGAITTHAEKTLFPEYDSIRPNVEFWEKVYTQYPLTNSIIHDIDNLAIIYEVIDLVDDKKPGAGKINRNRVKRIKEKYNTILKKLVRDNHPKTEEEQRVLALFGSNPQKSVLRAAINNIRSQRCQRDRFEKGLIRSGAYIQEIKKIFASYDLPTDLAYLPHVESSFDYKSYSKFGAAGIWQFTRSTGKRFMTVNYTLDERRDPIISSHAAARYLKKNYELLGDWPLAITAYNHGEAGMLRAKRLMGDYETIFRKYNRGSFKFASRNFYSEFLAAKEIAKNYRKYFSDLQLTPPLKVKEITMIGYASVQDLSRYFGIPLDTIKELNPALRRPVYTGQKYVPKGYRLRLPIEENVIRLADNIPLHSYKPEQKRSRFYRVRKGDTAGSIARKHKVRLYDLMMANQLDRKGTIYVGQNLRIPVPGEKIVLAQHVRQSKSKSSVHEKKVAKVRPQSPADGSHSVQRTEMAESMTKPDRKKEIKQADKAVRQKAEQIASAPVKVDEYFEEKQQTLVPSQDSVIDILQKPLPEEETSAPTTPEDSEVNPAVEKNVAKVRPQSPVDGSNRVQRTEMAESRTKPDRKKEIKQADKAVRQKAEQIASAPVKVDEYFEEKQQTLVPSQDSVIDILQKPLPEEETSALTTPDDSEVNPAVVTGNLQVEKVWSKHGRQYGIIKVEAGETLGHYAEWLEVPTQNIRKLNGYQYGKTIRMGQTLKIPLGHVNKDKFEERRYEYHKEIEEDFFDVYRVDEKRIYEIKKGDNIWTLCQKEFEIPFWLLKKYNHTLDFSNLKPNQRITVPVVTEVIIN